MELGKLFSSPIWLPDGAADSNRAPNARERCYRNTPTLRQPDTPTPGAKNKKGRHSRESGNPFAFGSTRRDQNGFPLPRKWRL